MIPGHQTGCFHPFTGISFSFFGKTEATKLVCEMEAAGVQYCGGGGGCIY